jgi:hypothetical protein
MLFQRLLELEGQIFLNQQTLTELLLSLLVGLNLQGNFNFRLLQEFLCVGDLVAQLPDLHLFIFEVDAELLQAQSCLLVCWRIELAL